MSASRAGAERSRAAESARTVSTWGRRRSPRSSALTAWTDRPAIVASSSCVNPAASRSAFRCPANEPAAAGFMAASSYRRQSTYGRRTSAVRALCVAATALALHTDDMTADAKATTFVTAPDGFIGTELVKVLTTHGHQVLGLTPSAEAARRVRRAGAVPVMGDLLEPGQWQDEAAADWGFHLPSDAPAGGRVTRRRAASIASRRVLMDAHLFDAVAAGR